MQINNGNERFAKQQQQQTTTIIIIIIILQNIIIGRTSVPLHTKEDYILDLWGCGMGHPTSNSIYLMVQILNSLFGPLQSEFIHTRRCLF